MIVLIDTCSLLSLVRYYIPFDNSGILLEFIKRKLTAGEIIVIDRVINECQWVAKGIVLDKLVCLKEKRLHANTESLIAPNHTKFLQMVDNQFCLGAQKNKLESFEYDKRKQEFLKGADIGLILFCLNMKVDSKLFEEEVIIVTEETEGANDNKLFMKIPAICRILGITTITLPQLLARYTEINIEFKSIV